MIQSEYGLTRDEFLDNAPFEIQEMIKRISDRKSGYKISEQDEINSLSKLTSEQEEKIRIARLNRFKGK